VLEVSCATRLTGSVPIDAPRAHLPRDRATLDYAFPYLDERSPMARRTRRTRRALLLATPIAALALGLPWGAAVGTRPAVAAPQPDPIPRRWELDVEAGPLRATVVDDADGEPRAYFYLTYKVTNRSGQELYLAPLWELATDEGEIIRSGRNVTASVYEAIIERLRNPFMQDEIDIQGLLLNGREHQRQGVVVWPAENLGIDRVAVFGAGFSGETRSYIRPDTGESVVLRKTLTLRHVVPGEIDPGLNPTLERVETQWTLR
jgi:hypothetical protein